MTVADLNCRQVRTYLYSLLSELEMRLGQFLLAQVSEQELLEMTSTDDSAGKYEPARKQFQADREKGVEARFVDYFYLSDLINIIKKKNLCSKLGYCSKTDFGDSLGPLNELRKTIAHPIRSVITGANTVDQLWDRIDHVEDALFRLRRSQEGGA